MAAKRKKRAGNAHPEPPDAVQDAIDYGIDISALRDNLALTPAERLRRHEVALDMVEMLRKAKRV